MVQDKTDQSCHAVWDGITPSSYSELEQIFATVAVATLRFES